MTATAIRTEVLNLSVEDRAELVDALWDSLSKPETKAREAAWALESERRIDACNTGNLTTRDAVDVFTELKKKLQT